MRVNPAHQLSQSTTLTLLAILVTITTWNTDPLLVWSWEFVAYGLCGWVVLTQPGRAPAATLSLGAIALWGFVQLATNATVYRWATLNAALQNLALAAAALTAYSLFGNRSSRAFFLTAFLRFSLILSVLAVLSYWTSHGKILWVFPSAYPDNWGPFPSRNNFAQFIELSFPLALAQLGHPHSRWTAAIPPAILLAAGLASASRAGAILLLAEAAVGLILLYRRRLLRRLHRPLLAFALASTALASIAGANVLLHRFAEPNPLELRRQIFRSAMNTIRTRPWGGYGLGSFSAVYPQFASFDIGATVEHAHNDWLEWSAEGGFLYAAAWATLALSIIRPALRSIWGLGIIAVFLHALADDPFARPGISLWVFLLWAALVREQQFEPQFERNVRTREKSRVLRPLCVGSFEET